MKRIKRSESNSRRVDFFGHLPVGSNSRRCPVASHKRFPSPKSLDFNLRN